MTPHDPPGLLAAAALAGDAAVGSCCSPLCGRGLKRLPGAGSLLA